jgi:hypothetical protein
MAEKKTVVPSQPLPPLNTTGEGGVGEGVNGKGPWVVGAPEGDTVRVALRVRPLIGKEKIERCSECVKIPNPKRPQVVIGNKRSFTYDYVYGPASSQQEVYRGCTHPLVESAFDGYNATVVAYGQTGSGKTFTMGSGNNIGIPFEDQGLIPTVAKEMFQKIENLERERPEVSVSVRVEFMEIYGEEMRDLLEPSGIEESEITLRTLENGQLVILGCKSEIVTTEDDMLRCLERGSICRTTGSTLMNTHSSRSHAIFTIFLEQSIAPNASGDGIGLTVEEGDPEIRSSKFHFVDLAGSERAKKTGAVGQRMREGININVGLLALGNVISALGDPSKKGSHVPYRDSKLTRVLQDSLGGNSKTLVIACVSPADTNFQETLSTLKYANRARNIKNKAVINRDAHSAQIDNLMGQIKALKLALVSQAAGVEGADVAELLQNLASPVTQGGVDWEARSRESEAELKRVTEELKEAKRKLSTVNEKTISIAAERDVLRLKLANAGISVSENLAEDPDYNIMFENQKLINKLQGDLANMIKENGELKRRPLTPNDSSSSPSWKSNQDIIEKAKAQVSLEQELLAHRRRSLGGAARRRSSENPKEEGVSDEIEDEEIDFHINDDETDDLEASFGEQKNQLDRGVADITAGIRVKEELIKSLEETNSQYNKMREFYAQKMNQMDAQIKQTQVERDQLLKDMEAMANDVSGAKQKAKEEMKKKFKAKEVQLQKQRKQLSEYKKFSTMKNNSERMVQEARRDLKRMKEQKVDLMRKREKELKSHREEMNRRKKEIISLRKVSSKKDQKISMLMSKNVQNEKQLKNRASQVAAAQRKLRQVQMQMQRLPKSSARSNGYARKNTSSGTDDQKLRVLWEKRAKLLVNIEVFESRLLQELTLRDHLQKDLKSTKAEKMRIDETKEDGYKAFSDDLADRIDDVKTQLEFQLQKISKMVDMFQKKQTHAQKIEKNLKNITRLPEAQMTARALFDLYVAQAKETVVAKKRINKLKENLNGAAAEIEQSKTAKEMQRTEFQQQLDKINREQQKKHFSMQGSVIEHGSLAMVEAPKASESKQIEAMKNELGSLRTMNTVHVSQMKDMKERVQTILGEKQVLTERVTQLWREIAKKEADEKSKDQHISWLEFCVQGQEEKRKKGKTASPPPAPSQPPPPPPPPEENAENSIGLPSLDEAADAIVSSNPKKQNGGLRTKHKSAMWSSRLSKPTLTQVAREEAIAASAEARRDAKRTNAPEKEWIGPQDKSWKQSSIRGQSADMTQQKFPERSKKKKNLKSIFDRLSDKTSFTGVSKQRHLNQQGNEATSDGNSGVNVKIIEGEENRNHQEIGRLNNDPASRSLSPSRRRKSVAANINASPTPEALTLGYIAGKSAAKAAREGSWKSPGRPSRKGKLGTRRLSIS